MILILVNTLDRNKKVKEKHKILLKTNLFSMILILVNIFDMNKKELYEKTSKTTTSTIFKLHKKNWTIFENFEGSRSNLPLTITVVVIFKFV